MYCDPLSAVVHQFRVRVVPKAIKAELTQSRTGRAEASPEIRDRDAYIDPLAITDRSLELAITSAKVFVHDNAG
jgi:hypothetical protein